MKKGILILLFISFISNAYCLEIKLLVRPVFGSNNILVSDTSYLISTGSEITFRTLKFYLSNLRFFNKDEIVYTEKNSFHLIDLNDESSMKIQLDIGDPVNYSGITFNLGIDSLTNVSGAFGGELDPMHGMYWTWQSGYINFKLEGSCINCPDPSKDFEFHLGGYLSPFYAMQEISLDAKDGKINEIVLDLKPFMEKLDLTKRNHIMSPGQEAVELSKLLSKCFRVN